MAPRGEGEVHADPAGRSGDQLTSVHEHYEFTRKYVNGNLASAVELAPRQPRRSPTSAARLLRRSSRSTPPAQVLLARRSAPFWAVPARSTPKSGRSSAAPSS